MFHGNLPPTRRPNDTPGQLANDLRTALRSGQPARGRRSGLPRALLAAALLGMAGLGGCQSQGMSPPAGAISADRVLGDILVRFSAPEVTTSVEASQLLAQAPGAVRFVVKRPMSGGIWLVTALTPDASATLDQAVTTLRAVPRVESADLERRLHPTRPMPTGRDMPAVNKMP